MIDEVFVVSPRFRSTVVKPFYRDEEGVGPTIRRKHSRPTRLAVRLHGKDPSHHKPDIGLS